MFRIISKRQFGPTTFLWDVDAPDVARSARPGHFIMARVDEHGERIPLTVADFDARRGTVTVVIQAVGSLAKAKPATSITIPPAISACRGLVRAWGGPCQVPRPLGQHRSWFILALATRNWKSRRMDAVPSPCP